MQKKWLREEKIYNNTYLKSGIIKIVSIINWLTFLLYLILLIIKKETTKYIELQALIFLGTYIAALLAIFVIFYLLGALSKFKYMIIYEINDDHLYIYDFNIKYTKDAASKYLAKNKKITMAVLNRKISIDLNNVKKIKIYPDKLKIYSYNTYNVFTTDKKVIKHITKFLKGE